MSSRRSDPSINKGQFLVMCLFLESHLCVVFILLFFLKQRRCSRVVNDDVNGINMMFNWSHVRRNPESLQWTQTWGHCVLWLHCFQELPGCIIHDLEENRSLFFVNGLKSCWTSFLLHGSIKLYWTLLNLCRFLWACFISRNITKYI